MPYILLACLLRWSLFYRRTKHTSLSHRKPAFAETRESDERDTQSTNRDALKSVFFRAYVTALPFGLNILFSALSSNSSE